MNNEGYTKLWLILVKIKPKKGHNFSDLIDSEGSKTENYIGAWANAIVKADTINQALTICPFGFEELGFELEFVDKIENFLSLVENDEVKEDLIKEGQWLLQSNFVFKISDKLFPY